ncbi:MAG: AtpZ/AtpI family protein [Turicibacter sp.]|nr:AtpZ/AtpI family protein [Turicibacter sp.]
MMQALAIFSQIGLTLMACVAIGVFIGRFLDSWLGTTPWFLLLFAFIGAGSAFKFIYDLSKRF